MTQKRKKELGGTYDNGGQFGSHGRSEATLPFAGSAKSAGKDWTSYDGVTYTPKVADGAIAIEVRLPESISDFVAAQVTIAGTADGVRISTTWAGESETFEELVTPAFDGGKLPAADSAIMVGAEWDKEVVHGDIRYIPFTTTSRSGIIAFSPSRGAVVISALPSEGTDEGYGTGNAFFYESTDPSWDGLGEPWTHVAWGEDLDAVDPVAV